MKSEEVFNNKVLNRKMSEFLPKFCKIKEKELLTKLAQEEVKLGNSKQLNFGLCLCLKMIFCNKSVLKDREVILINAYMFAEKFLQEILDITSYINLQWNFQTLQLFNYNELQQIAFKHLRKPNLLNNEDKELFNLETKLDSTEEEKNQSKNREDIRLIGYFTRLLREGDIENFDEKLFEMLDPKYKRIIAEEVCDNA